MISISQQRQKLTPPPFPSPRTPRVLLRCWFLMWSFLLPQVSAWIGFHRSDRVKSSFKSTMPLAHFFYLGPIGVVSWAAYTTKFLAVFFWRGHVLHESAVIPTQSGILSTPAFVALENTHPHPQAIANASKPMIITSPAARTFSGSNIFILLPLKNGARAMTPAHLPSLRSFSTAGELLLLFLCDCFFSDFLFHSSFTPISSNPSVYSSMPVPLQREHSSFFQVESSKSSPKTLSPVPLQRGQGFRLITLFS